MCSPSGIRGAGTAHEPHRHVFSTRLRTPGRHADDPPLYSPAPALQARRRHEFGVPRARSAGGATGSLSGKLGPWPIVMWMPPPPPPQPPCPAACGHSSPGGMRTWPPVRRRSAGRSASTRPPSRSTSVCARPWSATWSTPGWCPTGDGLPGRLGRAGRRGRGGSPDRRRRGGRRVGTGPRAGGPGHAVRRHRTGAGRQHLPPRRDLRARSPRGRPLVDGGHGDEGGRRRCRRRGADRRGPGGHGLLREVVPAGPRRGAAPGRPRSSPGPWWHRCPWRRATSSRWISGRSASSRSASGTDGRRRRPPSARPVAQSPVSPVTTMVSSSESMRAVAPQIISPATSKNRTGNELSGLPGMIRPGTRQRSSW